MYAIVIFNLLSSFEDNDTKGNNAMNKDCNAEGNNVEEDNAEDNENNNDNAEDDKADYLLLSSYPSASPWLCNRDQSVVTS